MSDSLSARLEELLARATREPWRHEGGGIVSAYTDGKPGIVDRGLVATMAGRQIADQDKANAALIVEAINALPALLSERSTLITGMEEARGALEQAHGAIAITLAFLGRGPGGENNRYAHNWAKMCNDLCPDLAKADTAILGALKEPNNGR